MADASVHDAASARPRVFISHSSQDVVAARELRTLLGRSGFAAWLAPDDIDGQATWVDQILAAAKSCPIMAVLLSRHSVESPHVAREVALALDHGRAVVPIRIEPVALSGPLEYLLHLVQWVDAFPAPLARHEQALVARLSSAASLPVPPSAAPAPRQRSRRMLWSAAGAVVVIAAATAVAIAAAGSDSRGGSGAGSGTGSSSTPQPDALEAIPTNLTSLGALDQYLPQVGVMSHLPQGSAVALTRSTNSHGSISFQAPNTWKRISGDVPYIDDTNRRIGDLLIASVDESRFFKLVSSGLFVGVAVPPRADVRNVDEQSPPQNYYDLGCVSSKVIHIAGPIAGQARVWGDCRTPEVVVTVYLAAARASISVVTIATTQRELDQVGAMLDSVDIAVAKVPSAR